MNQPPNQQPNQQPNQPLAYDLIIVGSGPAGLVASIYASRYRMSNLVIGKQKGGTIGLAHKVENWPGEVSISGLDLMIKIENQVQNLETEIIYDPVESIKKENGIFTLITDGEKKYQAKALILATGTERRKLQIPGEEEFLGKGVSFCTTCDAPFFRDKTVVLIGGGDAACSGAVRTAEYAKKVYLVYRKDELRAEPIWVNQIVKNPKIEVIYNTSVTEIKGDQVVEEVFLDNPYRGSKKLATDGVFIEIGGVPGNELAILAGVEIDESGYLKVNKEMKTSVKGIFAAGDTTDFLPHFQQMISAASMGAVAASSAYQYLKHESAPAQRGT